MSCSCLIDTDLIDLIPMCTRRVTQVEETRRFAFDLALVCVTNKHDGFFLSKC